jgi:molybdopterin synthase catalytic subunit
MPSQPAAGVTFEGRVRGKKKGIKLKKVRLEGIDFSV